MSQAKLGEMVNTSAQQIDRLEKGERKMTLEWMERLAGPLGVNPVEIVYEGISSSEVRRVPLIGAISCGNWSEAVELAEESVLSVVGGPRSFALKPIGDSMDELVDETGYIIIDPDETDLIDGKIYAVMNGSGETTAKRFRANPARLTPCSTNPVHKDIPIGQEPFRVLGRVVFAGREF